MAGFLSERGLSLTDSGQAEVFGYRITALTEEAIQAAIVEYASLAEQGGYRLLSVEAGNPEGGNAPILASVADYVPWWQVPDA